MKAFARVLMAVLLLVSLVDSAFALRVGFNPNIHNGTGQPAYDFHIEGVLFSQTTPVQYKDVVFDVPRGSIPGFDWTYNGSTLVQDPADKYMWHYSGSWSGTVPVQPCQWIHIGKKWDVHCYNVLMDLRGWWTDATGAKINPSAGTPGTPPGTWVSDVALLGFQVEDLAAPQTVTLQNATTEQAQFKNFEVAVTSVEVPLENMMEGDPLMDGLSWVELVGDTPMALAPGGTATFDLGVAGVQVNPATFLMMRGYEWDPSTGEFAFFADLHESHHLIPEPGGLAMVGLALMAVRRKRR